MWFVRVLGFIVITIAASSISLGVEDATVFSGPQVGEKLPALKGALVYGQDSGKTVDFIEMAAGKPTLLVIVNGTNRPAANLTRSLMNFAEMRSDALFAGVVYLDGDPSAAEQYLRQAISWWGVGPPVGISIDGAEGPGSYGLNRNVNLTVLVADKGRVKSNFPLIQPSTTDAPTILKEVVALIGGRVPTTVEIDFLAMPTSKPASAPFPTAPPNVKMRELICTALAAEDEARAKSAASALEQYVQHDKDRQAILGNTATMLIYRSRLAGAPQIPIVEHIRKWSQVYATSANEHARK